ncbi:NADH dehydrogenase [candidate division TA06 bacterium DG_24]|uniref:NADH dehydrogenase n=3 Tax=Bacteria division TA06 TaxID=1156500 RepID=A0A0S8JPD7_UNCT6|nr:MAG: NADH dehydrogenase [candidate division TA06 bacterium DG_24]KPK71503.1 MAG: NADH dehydrogenase [candidate division TA06 bacterium SM23_40]KPL11620.1 MAG: NADH dehydrogenase [candidate division TA06 bacterium SM1_40]
MANLRSINDLERLRKEIVKDRDPDRAVISISSATCGQARGSLDIVQAFEEAIGGHEDRISLRVTGCHGFCNAEPNVIIYPGEIFYQHLKPDDASRVVESVLKEEIVDNLVVSENGDRFVHLCEIPFYRSQVRAIMGDNPLIDPTRIDDYIAVGGYRMLGKIFEMEPEEVVEEIKRSGLRGRGGAGFSTGKKWEVTRQQPGPVKYIICNADEGDPGAYMDRSILESNPHSVIEGMILGAYAIGANEGWIYVRNEYPLAVKHIMLALEQAEGLGLLGESILGSGFSFDIKVARGAGAFVCGEETALIYSIEGLRGTPRQRPPFPAQRGLFGRPTNINNVETWANVPEILEKGADWFSGIGTKTSKGTKIFSLVGKIANTGLVEVPMGITLREVIFDVGGGAPGGKSVKAVQTGGPSGGCIPAELFGLPVDYESLTEAGSIMGSGGMIVMDENTCMVDVARYFTHFLQDESCGKCVTCREGTQRMYEILTDIVEGRGSEEDLDLLEQLGETVKDTSLCGLGQTAANPVLSTIEYFRDEYMAHIRDKKCPAGVCKALIQYTIDEEACTGCVLCKKNCPQEAILGEPKKLHTIIQEKCIKCGICHDLCKYDAVIIS